MGDGGTVLCRRGPGGGGLDAGRSDHGRIQKIFYLHLPAAINALLACALVFVASLGYLWQRRTGWDDLAAAAAKVAALMCSVVLVTGMIWGRAAWGQWWTWSPRLTFSLVLWLLYVVYLMIRPSVESPSQRAMVAAVYGVAAFLDVPLVYLSARLMPDIHPPSVPMDAAMKWTLVLCLLPMTLLAAGLVLASVRKAARRRQVQAAVQAGPDTPEAPWRGPWQAAGDAPAGLDRFRSATMNFLLHVGNWLLPLLYLALLVDYGVVFMLRVRPHSRNAWLWPVLACHAAFLTACGIHLGRPPLESSQEVLSVVALAAAAVYAVMEIASRDRRAGFFVFALVFLFQYTASMFLAGHALTPAPAAGPVESPWGRRHVLPATLAYTALGFAAVYGALYLMGRRNLRLHKLGLLFDRLPPLELLGRLSWYALVAGFALMSLTILTGVLTAALGGNAHPAASTKLTAKIVIGSLAWGICGLAVVGRLLGRWSAAWTARIALAGFLVVVVLLATSIMLS